MLLAQISNNVDYIASWATPLAVLIGALGLQLSNWRKDKRDQVSEEQKSKYLERIAISNEESVRVQTDIKVAQAEVKTTLALHGQIGNDRYNNLIAAVERLPCEKFKNQNTK
jgi:hypothetical protein